jgi:drug/metabolite transporter (DMT)-like permease
MVWFWVVITGHLFNAGAFVIDKYLLSKSVPNPVVYSYYIGLLGLAALILLPFGVVVPGVSQVFIAFLAGILFIVALLFFFSALKYGDTSTVVPLIGGVQPIIIFFLSYFLLGERFDTFEIIAFFLLICGGILISYEPSGKKRKLTKHTTVLLFSSFAAFFFAFSFVVTKYVYSVQNFVSGFFWSRFGAALFVLSFLLFPFLRKQIFAVSHHVQKGTKVLFLGNQVLGAFGFVLLNYAISLASVTMVNALQGMQYAFLFLLILLLSRKYPALLSEALNREIVIRKTVAIAIIGMGLFFLTRV